MSDPGVEDFWDSAPSGHVIAHPDGRIIRANATLARWLGYEPDALCGMAFSDLLTAGGRILYDTHFGPLLHLGRDLNGVTVDVLTADGTRLPMFLTANVKLDSVAPAGTAADHGRRRRQPPRLRGGAPGGAQAGRGRAGTG